MMDLDGLTDNTDDRGTHNLFQGPATVALNNVDLPFHPGYELAAPAKLPLPRLVLPTVARTQ